MKHRMSIQEHSYGIIPVSKKESEWHVLIVKHNTGHWAFPKGHREPGENSLQAALRELREETGITDVRLVSDEPITELYSYKKGDVIINKRVDYFIGFITIPTITLQSKELGDYRWLPIDGAMKQVTFAESRNILSNIKPILEQFYTI